MEVKMSCPYGHTCETAKDGHIERCILYVSYPMTVIETQEVKEIFDCSHNWSARFARESAQTNRGQTRVLEQIRNIEDKLVQQLNGPRKNGKEIEYNG